MWEFLGGKLDADETPKNYIVRESREELGVEYDSTVDTTQPFSGCNQVPDQYFS